MGVPRAEPVGRINLLFWDVSQPTRRCNPRKWPKGAPQLHLSSWKRLWKPEVTRPTTAASAPTVQHSAPLRPSSSTKNKKPLTLTASVFVSWGTTPTPTPFFYLKPLLSTSLSPPLLPPPSVPRPFFPLHYFTPVSILQTIISHPNIRLLPYLYKQGMDSL